MNNLYQAERIHNNELERELTKIQEAFDKIESQITKLQMDLKELRNYKI